MANITDVKLPDNSQYDLKDNVSGYAKKVAGATTDDLASLTATGDLADSGKKLSDLVLKTDVKDVLNSTSTTDPLSANMGHALAGNLAANENVYGAKQMIPYPYSETTKTENGVTFTDNGDGTISVSGTPGTVTQFHCNTFYLKNGTYKLSGGIAGGSGNTYMVYLTYADTLGDNTFVYNVDNLSTEFTINGSYGDLYGAMCAVYIYQAVTLASGSTFKPMIRDARVIDPTFAPFAKTNLQLTRKTSGLSNENLLDNGWFTVNQRGATGAISTPGAYVSDRWRLTAAATVTVAGDALTLSTGAQISQNRETGLVSGKTYTLSIKLSNGDIEHATGTYNGEVAKVFLDNANFEAGYVTADYDIYIYAKSKKTITAVKLELGTVSTLANDVAPSYTTELLKCQRYFYRILSNSSSAFIAVGFMADLHTFYGTINLPVPMRGTPTSLFGGVLQIYTTGGTEDVSTLLINMRSPQILTIAATSGNSLTVNSPAILMGVANSYIDISADL